MKRWIVVAMVACACSSSEGGHAPKPAGPGASSGPSATSSGPGGDGGSGGQGDAGGACDPFLDEGCCAPHATCPSGALGPCAVELELCAGECVGKPNPVPDTPCGNGGTCRGTQCVEPEVGGGGMGGGGGDGIGGAR
jgi:hypothetical protein